MPKDEKRLSARIDNVRAYFIAQYKRRHFIKKDIDVINNALDALKEKEDKKTYRKIKNHEDKLFKIMALIAGLHEHRNGDQDSYLSKLHEATEEIKKIIK